MITVLSPTYFLKSVYSENIGRRWNGKRSCFSLSFDCDFIKDIETIITLLDILSSYSFKAIFACVGKWIEKYPREHMKIVEEGHEIINHTYTHPNNEELNSKQKFNELGMEQQREEIKKCHEACKRVLDYEPIGFRTPHFGILHTNSVYGILRELGYKYSSSTIAVRHNNGVPFLTEEKILEFPLSGCPKHPFGVFDTWHSFRAPRATHKNENEFHGLFKKLIEIGINTNSYINVYFDPQDIVKLRHPQALLDYVEGERKNIWVATYKNLSGKWEDDQK